MTRLRAVPHVRAEFPDARHLPSRAIQETVADAGGREGSMSLKISLSLGGILKLLLATLSLLLVVTLGVMATKAWHQYETATHVHRIDAGADLLLRAAEQMTLERGLTQTALLGAAPATEQA